MKRLLFALIILVKPICLLADEVGWVTSINFTKDTAWVLTNEGIYKMWLNADNIEYERVIIKQPKGLDVDVASSVFVDSNTNVWFTTDSGIYLFDNNSWNRYDVKGAWQIVEYSGRIYCMSIVGNDYSFFELQNGAFVEIAKFIPPKEFSSHTPNFFIINGEEIWVGSSYRKLFIYKDGKWTSSVDIGTCWGLLQTSKETVIATGKELRFKDKNLSYPGDRFNRFFVDKQDNIFCYNLRDLYKVVGSEWRVILACQKEDGDYVLGVNNGECWIGGFKKISIYKEDKIYELDSFVSYDEFAYYDIINTPLGDFYVDDLKVGVINDKDGFTNVRKEANPKSKVVSTILEGQDFWYLEIGDSDWWYVYKNDEAKGYMHKSRIREI